jgi:hypothetical protein
VFSNIFRKKRNYCSCGFFNNRIRAAALYTTRLTNAELATLTTP